MQQWLWGIWIIGLQSLIEWVLTYNVESVQCNSGWNCLL